MTDILRLLTVGQDWGWLCFLIFDRCYKIQTSLNFVFVIIQRVRSQETMLAVRGETFVSSMSRDVLEDCLGVLFNENKARLESGSAANDEVIAEDLTFWIGMFK